MDEFSDPRAICRGMNRLKTLAGVTPIVPQPEVDPKVCLVKIGQQYGQRVIHPANETANIFCRIAGSKTLTQRLVDDIKRLGYSVEVVQDLPKEL
jgi:hypothetical protein